MNDKFDPNIYAQNAKLCQEWLIQTAEGKATISMFRVFMSLVAAHRPDLATSRYRDLFLTLSHKILRDYHDKYNTNNMYCKE